MGYRSIWSAGSGPRFHSFPLRFDVQDHEYRPGTPILLAAARAVRGEATAIATTDNTIDT